MTVHAGGDADDHNAASSSSAVAAEGGDKERDSVRHRGASMEEEADGSEAGARKRRNKQARGMSSSALAANDNRVKIALSLYKVQQNIYLLDFQRVEVSESQVGESVRLGARAGGGGGAGGARA